MNWFTGAMSPVQQRMLDSFTSRFLKELGPLFVMSSYS